MTRSVRLLRVSDQGGKDRVRTPRFRVNSPSVISEVIDGEVVALDFASGSYFSIRESGATIWRLMEAGADLAQIGTVLAGKWRANRREIDRTVQTFVEELEAEGLVVDAEFVPLDPGISLEEIPIPDAFHEPIVERFDEMKEMLLYDPIHDVDDTGWPNRPGDTG